MPTETSKYATPPSDITGLDMAFGGRAMELLPPFAEIPEEFRRSSNTWVKFQSEWFFQGLVGAEIIPREGIDLGDALKALTAIQASWEPQHEHKEAGVAYLASLWLLRAKANGRVFGEPEDES
jgi:hypothetical protein